MLTYPNIDPDIIAIGPIHLRWYGAMYLLGFLAAYGLIPRQRRSRELGLDQEVVQDLILYLAIGLVLGARLGYLIFYQFPNAMAYLRHPLEIIATWHGGMSFHGGLLGCFAAGLWFCRRRRLPFWAVADSVIVAAPIGLGAGRIGNFINGELYGRPSAVPWAMVFPQGGPLPRHPSQLYEALLEGAILFAILWWLRRRPFRDGMMVAFFLLFYGSFRFAIEFFREPDAQLGLVVGFLSMGQVLCLTMMLGAGLLAWVLPAAAASGSSSSPGRRRPVPHGSSPQQGGP